MRRPEFVICCALLIGFIALMKYGLKEAFELLGFWPWMAICVIGTSLIIAAAFWYDRVQARSQALPPRELNDRPPSMP